MTICKKKQFRLIAFMSNGLDTFGGPMMMMPYGGPPYSINSPEYYNNNPDDSATIASEQPFSADVLPEDLEIQSDITQKRHSIDSQVKYIIYIYIKKH